MGNSGGSRHLSLRDEELRHGHYGRHIADRVHDRKRRPCIGVSLESQKMIASMDQISRELLLREQVEHLGVEKGADHLKRFVALDRGKLMYMVYCAKALYNKNERETEPWNCYSQVGLCGVGYVEHIKYSEKISIDSHDQKVYRPKDRNSTTIVGMEEIYPQKVMATHVSQNNYERDRDVERDEEGDRVGKSPDKAEIEFRKIKAVWVLDSIEDIVAVSLHRADGLNNICNAKQEADQAEEDEQPCGLLA